MLSSNQPVKHCLSRMRKRSDELLLCVYLHLSMHSYTKFYERDNGSIDGRILIQTSLRGCLPLINKCSRMQTLNAHAHPRMCHILVHTCCMPSGMSCTSCMPMCTPSRHVMNIMHVYVQMHTHLMFPSEHPYTRAHILMCVYPCGCPHP